MSIVFFGTLSRRSRVDREFCLASPQLQVLVCVYFVRLLCTVRPLISAANSLKLGCNPHAVCASVVRSLTSALCS